jgi:hypothetical protein
MARIKIKDLPVEHKVTKEEMRTISAGSGYKYWIGRDYFEPLRAKMRMRIDGLKDIFKDTNFKY